MPAADCHTHHTGDGTRMHVGSGFEGSVSRLYTDHVSIADRQRGSDLRIDLHGQTPHRTGSGIWQLLHPRQVGGATIVEFERQVRLKLKWELAGLAGEGCHAEF